MHSSFLSLLHFGIRFTEAEDSKNEMAYLARKEKLTKRDKGQNECYLFLLLLLKKLNVKGRSGRSLRMLSSKKTKKENQDPKALLTESHLWRMRHTKVVQDLVQIHHKNHLQVQRFLLFVLLI